MTGSRIRSRRLFRFTADVVVEQGHYASRGGVLPVPAGPGPGGTIDRAALARLAERYRTEGAMATGVPGERLGDGYVRR